MKSFLPIYGRVLPGTIPGYEGDEVPLTKDAIAKMISDAVNGTVNSAIANLKKGDLPKIVKDSLTESLGPINEQFTSLNEALKALKPVPAGGDNVPAIPPEINAEIKALKENSTKMQKNLDDMRTEKEAAENRAKTLERHTKIRSALGTVKEGYANDTAAATAFTLIEPLIKETEDGQLIGGDNLPVEDFVQDYLPKQHPYLLKPTGASGAGASGGSGGNRGGKVATLEMIKPGMTPEERALVLSQIQTVGSSNR